MPGWGVEISDSNPARLHNWKVPLEREGGFFNHEKICEPPPGIGAYYPCKGVSLALRTPRCILYTGQYLQNILVEDIKVCNLLFHYGEVFG